MGGSPSWMVLVSMFLLFPAGAAAQEEVGDTLDARIREARGLREEMRFREAAERLRAYLREHPEDAGVLRLLATTLRRGGQPAAAREVYEEALRRQPIDPLLRIDYADLLVELSAETEARRILGSVIGNERVPEPVRADARVLLGRLALAAETEADAEAEFRTALALHPGHPDARRHLGEMYRQRVPWVRVGLAREDDDQPLGDTRFALDVEREILPWLQGRAGLGLRGVGGDSSDETVPDVRVGGVARWEFAKVEARGWGGVFRRSLTEETDWQARGALAFLGPAGLRIRVHAERGPYLRTDASLATTLTPTVFGGAVGRPDVIGWAGNLEYSQAQFREGLDLKVEEVRAWLLAPVLRDRGGTLRIGYEFYGADADDVLFVPTLDQDIPFEGPIPGRYDPVYTPEQVQAHSVRMDVRIETDGTLTGTLDGAWSFSNEEEAPLLFSSVPEVPGAGVSLQFERRSFDPWRVQASVRYVPVPVLELVADAGYRSNAFRDYSFFRLGATLFDLPMELR